jgi:hypothetical protein
MEIRQEVMGHLNQLFAEMAGAIGAMPEELWHRGADREDMLRVPCFLAHHMVWCMVLKHLLRIPAASLPHNVHPDYAPDKLLTKRQVLDLLADIRAYAGEVYGQMPNEAYLAADDSGQSPLGRLMYTLAHTRHHYGQIVQILRDHGLDGPDWYPLR